MLFVSRRRESSRSTNEGRGPGLESGEAIGPGGADGLTVATPAAVTSAALSSEHGEVDIVQGEMRRKRREVSLAAAAPAVAVVEKETVGRIVDDAVARVGGCGADVEDDAISCPCSSRAKTSSADSFLST